MSTYRKIHGRSIQAVTTDPTESYDGSAFSTSPSLSTGRDGDGSGSSASEGVQVAGYIPSGSYSSATEQFTPESTAANIADFTTS